MFRLRFLVVPLVAAGVCASVFVGACASDDPVASPNDAGGSPTLLGDSAIEAEAAVPTGDICGNAGGLEANSAWPLAGGCPKRSGASTHTGPQVAGLKWTSLLAAGGSAPAISADGVTWVGTADGLIAGIDGNGNSFGAYQTGGAVKASPVRSATGLTIVGSTDGMLYAVVGGVPGDAGADAGEDAEAGPPAARPRGTARR